jgi:hypothetical protein
VDAVVGYQRYYYAVPQRTFTFDELAALLERFSLERAGVRTSDEITASQVQLLLARIAALTEVLRDALPGQTTQLASRMLLKDLSEVAAHFRGRANVLRPLLAEALTQVRESLAAIRATTEQSKSSGGVAV